MPRLNEGRGGCETLWGGNCPWEEDRKGSATAPRRRDSRVLLSDMRGVLARSGLVQMFILLGREVSSENPGTYCVSLGTLHSLPVPQFPHLPHMDHT